MRLRTTSDRAPMNVRTRWSCGARRIAAILVGALGLIYLATAAAARAESRCTGANAFEPDSSAQALMVALERDFRTGTRVVRMDIRTTYPRARGIQGEIPAESEPKTLWGIIDADSDTTRLLYVFSGPARLAGTALLMHDRVAANAPDAMWLYLRSFDIFEKLASEKSRILVPGTALSYEDSRGFIPTDKYQFAYADGSTADEANPQSVSILACPRSASIREDLGYRSLLLQVDSKKRIVRYASYEGPSGGLLKTYSLVDYVRMGERHLPAEVRLEHCAEGFYTRIAYEYWQPDTAPGVDLFDPSPETSRFIDRLEGWLTQIGQGARIRAELDEADERVRQFEERLRRIQAGERVHTTQGR
jgi:hypothetical protein